jgi:guanine nucleotide-binding protein G(i) subunit alpha
MTRIMAYQVKPDSSFIMEQEIAEQIHQVWQDPVVRAIVDNYSDDFYLMDSAS